jgi:hypothetical protein
MKKIILFFAFLAIFYSVAAQSASDIPETMVVLKDQQNCSMGFLFIHEESKKINLFPILSGQEPSKGSRAEKNLISLILKAYSENYGKKEVKIVGKIYKEKHLRCIVLEKQGLKEK